MAVQFKACSVADCNGNAHWRASGKRGLCSKHYKRGRKTNPGAAAPRCSVEGCLRLRDTHGLCALHYGRWLAHGDALAEVTGKGDLPRFIREVAIPYTGDDCLIWPFCENGSGYGVVTKDGGKDYVHRLVCEATQGPAPSPDHFAIHSCGNGHLGCVAGRHLRWGTQKQNGEDMVAHGTSPRGEKHGQSKLTEDQVREIRARSPRTLARHLAAQFNVAQRTINDVASRRTWAWLS